MKKTHLILMTAGLIFLAFNSSAKEVNRVFQSKGKVKVNTVSGDLKVIPRDTEEIIVNITYTFNDDEFNFDFEDDDTQLIWGERFLSHNKYSLLDSI